MDETRSSAERDDLLSTVRDLERRVALVEKHLASVAYSVGVPKPKE